VNTCSNSFIAIARGGDPDRSFRPFVVWDEENNRIINLVTNHLKFGSTTVSAIYKDKDRWEIEIFSKTLKQHLKVKTFIGTSENALRIQIWTAMT